jgi:hypothetical protein
MLESDLELKPRNGRSVSFGVLQRSVVPQVPPSRVARKGFLSGTYSIVDRKVWIFIAASVLNRWVLQILRSFRCKPW